MNRAEFAGGFNSSEGAACMYGSAAGTVYAPRLRA
jgi:hypothetical protein